MTRSCRSYDERYPTSVRAITGKSSGDTHAGDALFELCYLPDFPEAVRAPRDAYDGSFEKFWADFRSRPAHGAVEYRYPIAWRYLAERLISPR